MSGILGALNINPEDSDRVFLSTIGQGVVYDAVQQVVSQYNQEVAMLQELFVDQVTENFKDRYRLPAGGRMQRMSRNARPALSKVYGYWDVAYPLYSFQDALGADRITFAYMTVADLDRHLTGVFVKNDNSMRWELLHRLLDNAAETYEDELHGDLTVQPLANGDEVVYPPVLGSESEATEDHYIEAAYAASAISDTNNPIATIVADLNHHFGVKTGGENIVVFINTAQTAKIKALTGFVEVQDRFVEPGDDTATVKGLPYRVPGKILGRVSGAWIVEWPWVPASYAFGIYMDAPKPLVMRVDPANTGLPRGLNLVARDVDYPFESSYWENRYGFGCGNRLNGVVIEMPSSSDGEYAVPTDYD